MRIERRQTLGTLDRKNVPEGRLQFTISHCPFYEEVEENLKMTKTKRL